MAGTLCLLFLFLILSQSSGMWLWHVSVIWTSLRFVWYPLVRIWHQTNLHVYLLIFMKFIFLDHFSRGSLFLMFPFCYICILVNQIKLVMKKAMNVFSVWVNRKWEKVHWIKTEMKEKNWMIALTFCTKLNQEVLDVCFLFSNSPHWCTRNSDLLNKGRLLLAITFLGKK